MRILTVLANPNKQSFSRVLADKLTEVADEKGHESAVVDLYEEGFQPVLSAEDFEQFNRGLTPDDIRVQQERVSAADVVAFIHPVWWFGMPAVMKGWIDRVFSYGFAYSHDSRGVKPLLTGKKAIVLNAAGGAEKQSYGDTGFKDAMIRLNDAGIYRFVGFDIILRRFFFEVPVASDEKKREMVEQLHGDLWKIL